MAIVFISPKAKRKVFLRLAIMLVFLAVVVFLLVFIIVGSLNMKRTSLPKATIPTSDIAINFDVIDSPKVLSLEPFVSQETEFTYMVKDDSGKEIQGAIFAASKENAKILLEEAGFTVVSLEEMKIGRSEPFVAY